jgi:periplasmic protein TonB
MTGTGKMRLVRYGFFSLAALAHLFLLLYFRYNVHRTEKQAEPEASVIKLVDFQEYIPPPPPTPPKKPEKEIVEVNDQPAASERIIETEKEIVEAETPSPAVPEPEYLPQHKISKIPEIPANEILSRIEYPPMALRQKREAVVYVELYIDNTGLVRQVVVLKDPGYGFAEAAVKALEGLRCGPAEANGVPAAVRFRYPIRFVLQ